MQNLFRVRLFTLLTGFLALATTSPTGMSQELPGTDSRITESEIVAAQQFGQTLSIAEWLGPMAPVALSPFFGITCLSGMSLYGGGWVSPGNPMIGERSPLHNPMVFWTFVGLTLLTSIPRLTKVSKPFAQAVDQLEAWSGIITMIVLKVMIASAGGAADVEMPVAQMGMFTVPADVLMMIAAVINIFVINAVKFFFEVLIWLTPIPLLDAAFEACNKAACAALMALYAWSPATAASLNALLFITAALIFRWVHRREIFFRTLLFDVFRAFAGTPKPKSKLTVFPVTAIGSIRARSRCILEVTSDGWRLSFEPWFRRTVSVEIPRKPGLQIQCGVFSNSIRVPSAGTELSFSRLYNASLPELAAQMKLEYPAVGHEADANNVSAEFA